MCLALRLYLSGVWVEPGISSILSTAISREGDMGYQISLMQADDGDEIRVLSLS
jgi:hypothetical protein